MVSGKDVCNYGRELLVTDTCYFEIYSCVNVCLKVDGWDLWLAGH